MPSRFLLCDACRLYGIRLMISTQITSLSKAKIVLPAPAIPTTSFILQRFQMEQTAQPSPLFCFYMLHGSLYHIIDAHFSHTKNGGIKRSMDRIRPLLSDG